TLRRYTVPAGLPHRASISPDGKLLAFTQIFKGEQSLWLGSVATNTNIEINRYPGRIYSSLAFAPDGNSIYFTAADERHSQWTLMRVSILGGAESELLTGVTNSFAFSPDGRQLAFVRANADERAIIIVDAEDGKNERALVSSKANENFSTYSLAWSPDG